jgi:hypothetical protein
VNKKPGHPPLQLLRSGGCQGTGFVSKISPDGTSLVYSTYQPGNGSPDNVEDVVVDSFGHAFVTGSTRSSDFPTTAGAYQENINPLIAGSTDAFVTKLNPSGSDLVYSTYIGDRNQETGTGIALHRLRVSYG